MSSMSRPLSGTQFTIESDGYRAVVASVGASLRSLAYAGRDLVVPFDANEIRPAYRGANLAPWPNRLANGAYTMGGVARQLPINEVARMTALHGLVTWNEWELRVQSSASITLGTVIEPQLGYPHRLDVEARFSLTASGLNWQISATNISPDRSAAPYGVGPHPYLVAGPGTIDSWSLQVPASTILQVTPDRLLPAGLADVATHDGGYFDFQRPRPVGATEIDHAYTSLSPASDEAGDGEHDVEVRLLATDGSGVFMRWNAVTLPWVQVHTADTNDSQTNRIGLAVEPMSCPPDAFNSGTDLVTLNAGERHEAGWLIAAL